MTDLPGGCGIFDDRRDLRLIQEFPQTPESVLRVGLVLSFSFCLLFSSLPIVHCTASSDTPATFITSRSSYSVPAIVDLDVSIDLLATFTPPHIHLLAFSTQFGRHRLTLLQFFL